MIHALQKENPGKVMDVVSLHPRMHKHPRLGGRFAIIFLVFALISGTGACPAQKGGQKTQTPPAASTEDMTPEPPMVPTPPPPASQKPDGAKLRAEYTARRNAAPGTCSTDDDCMNVPGGIDDCGRVIDAKTARTIEPLFDAFTKACGTQIDCAPKISIPRCQQSHCIRAQE